MSVLKEFVLLYHVLEFHGLGIETGRWHKPVTVPINEKKYRSCSNSTEDEFHFVLECLLYDKFRKDILSYTTGEGQILLIYWTYVFRKWNRN